MELKTPMVFVKHIISAQRGDAQSIQFLCERTSGQFVKICRKYDLSNSEIEAVLAKAYGLIFADIKSVRNPQTFMSWAGKIVEDCCVEIAGPRLTAPEPTAKEPAPTEPTVKETATPPAPVTKKEPVPEKPSPAVIDDAAAATPSAAMTAGAAAAVSATAMTAGAAAAVTVSEPKIEPAKEAPAETGNRPAAFYDENAYVQPSGTYHAEVNYADEASREARPVDNRVIPVDELVYHPEASYISSGEPSAPSDVQQSITPDSSIYASIPTFASSYEEEAVFQDVYPAAADKPEYADNKAAENSIEAGSSAEPADFPTENVSAIPEETVQAEAGDEPDIDLYEKEENAKAQDDADVEVNDSDYGEDDENDEDEDDEELESGLAFRTKVLIGLLCVFIFGACIGIGYAISKGMTAREPSSVEPGVQETQADTIDETETESLVDSLIDSVMESLSESSVVESGSSRETTDTANTDTTDTADTGNQTPESTSTGNAGNQTPESQAADPASGTGGEVTARADIATYLGGTFASVFRDYPDIPRSVYRGELSLTDTHIGFIGSYDATQPVSSTVVESVSLLNEGGNYNINGFYVGMTAEDAESLAAAGNYTALEMTAESSREYVDNNDNTLSLTIDGGKVKSVTLRSSSADNVTMETADEVTYEVTEEVPEEIPGEEGGVG